MHRFVNEDTTRTALHEVGTLKPLPARAREPDWSAVYEALEERFEVVRALGCGASGSVFEARDRQTGRPVAIKALRSRFHASPDVRARFRREAAVIARLRHPNVIALRELCESRGLLYMVLEFVAGESLFERLHPAERLSADQALMLMRDLASALVHVHAAGIVHRDIKPENVLVTRASGRAVLTDFGIAALKKDDPWGAGWAPGTPQYMSPEQSEGRKADPRCDIYSLGVLGYRVLAGRLPFDGSDPALLAASHRDLSPPPLAGVVPPEAAPLISIIERCLAKRASSRFRDAAALRSALLKIEPESDE